MNDVNFNPTSKPIAVVLLSGGLDSATCLAWAQQYYSCICVSFRYGQRHVSELQAAIAIAKHAGVSHRIIDIDLASIGGSSLTDSALTVPINFDEQPTGIPSTYVPARNTIFLSYALAVAEVSNAQAIVIGVNAVDYSGYPDCRPEYIQAFQTLANLATKTGVEGQSLTILTPLLHLSKAKIIELGNNLHVNYQNTVSCYQATIDGLACGKCDSCRLRQQGFAQAHIPDPTRYI